MPTEHVAGLWRVAPATEPATTRILRLATGTALSLALSLVVNAPGAFLVPVLVAFLLSLPVPAPGLRGGIVFVLVLVLALLVGLALLPLLHYMPVAGVLLLALGLFGCFFYSAKGGSMIVGTFLTIGLTVVPALGSESIDLAIGISKGLSMAAVVAMLFVWLAHALFPEPQPTTVATSAPTQQPSPPSVIEAGNSALRSLLVVLPVIVWVLVTSGTAGYAAVLVKVATLGQQANADHSRDAGRSLMLSTVFGGVGAMLIWLVLQLWPSLLIYCLLLFLASLMMGPRIFSGRGLTPSGAMWSYALVTMIVILGSTVTDAPGGTAAGAKSFDRLVMFLIATVYAVAAVEVFDRLLPKQTSRAGADLR